MTAETDTKKDAIIYGTMEDYEMRSGLDPEDPEDKVALQHIDRLWDIRCESADYFVKLTDTTWEKLLNLASLCPDGVVNEMLLASRANPCTAIMRRAIRERQLADPSDLRQGARETIRAFVRGIIDPGAIPHHNTDYALGYLAGSYFRRVMLSPAGPNAHVLNRLGEQFNPVEVSYRTAHALATFIGYYTEWDWRPHGNKGSVLTRIPRNMWPDVLVDLKTALPAYYSFALSVTATGELWEGSLQGEDGLADPMEAEFLDPDGVLVHSPDLKRTLGLRDWVDFQGNPREDVQHFRGASGMAEGVKEEAHLNELLKKSKLKSEGEAVDTPQAGDFSEDSYFETSPESCQCNCCKGCKDSNTPSLVS